MRFLNVLYQGVEITPEQAATIHRLNRDVLEALKEYNAAFTAKTGTPEPYRIAYLEKFNTFNAYKKLVGIP